MGRRLAPKVNTNINPLSFKFSCDSCNLGTLGKGRGYQFCNLFFFAKMRSAKKGGPCKPFLVIMSYTALFVPDQCVVLFFFHKVLSFCWSRKLCCYGILVASRGVVLLFLCHLIIIKSWVEPYYLKNSQSDPESSVVSNPCLVRTH